MTVLGLDAAGPALAVGLLRDGTPLADVRLLLPQAHSRILLRVVRDVLRDAGVEPRGLGLVAVSAGPGSYTGLRLAATAAKVLAWAAGARVAGVDALQVRAAAALAALPAAGSATAPAGGPAGGMERVPAAVEGAPARWVAAVLPARRAELYGRLFAPGWPPAAAGPLVEGPAGLVVARLARAARDAGGGVLFVGEGVWEAAGPIAAEGGALPADGAAHLPQGVLVARLGLLAAGRGEAEDPVRFLPRYAGPPPAREPAAREPAPPTGEGGPPSSTDGR